MDKKFEDAILDQRENIMDQQQQQQSLRRRKKGGFITMPFIIANEAFEKVASYGLAPNMILYLIGDYHLNFTQGTNILFLWNAATNFMPTLGAFISDSFLGKYPAIGLGSIFSFLGMLLLWITAMVPQFRPPPCEPPQSCKSASSSQLAILIGAFALMSIGAGGVRPCSMAFGADQFSRRYPNNERILESFFGWYYASTAVSILIAFTGIVYIQDHLGWKVGFGVPAILMFLSAFLFFVASPFYIKVKASHNLFTGFVQVIVVAFKNRKLSLPPRDSNGWYHYKKGSEVLVPTDHLRFLNKACIIRNPEQDISPDGSALNPWSLCTADKVEELKAIVRVIPLWSTGIMISVTLSQNSFPLLQARSMNRHIGGFEYPAGSFALFVIVSLFLWVALYERVILPLASKIMGRPVRLSTKLRMGIGLFLSCLSMAVSGLVENIRRRKAIQEGFANKPDAVLSMSAFWLVPQHCLVGLAEAFNAIGQTEFYYNEFPKSISSIASSMFGLAMAVASLLASVILSTVDKITSKGGKPSWVSTNINQAHYDYYYWVLGVMCVINLLYFLVCSKAYGPCKEPVNSARNDMNGLVEEQTLTSLGNKVGDEENDLKEHDLKENGFKEPVNSARNDMNGLEEEQTLTSLGNKVGDEENDLKEHDLKENGFKENGLKEEGALSKSKEVQV